MSLNIYQSDQYKVLDVIQQSGDNFLIRIKTGLHPQPGQFVNVSIPGIGEAPISSASFNNKLLDLNVRVVGKVTKAICDLKKGDIVHVRGPYGYGYPMDKFKGKNIILIGGGCGVAPLRGIIQYLEKHREDYKDIHLFFGYRSPKDVLFKDEVYVWKSKFELNLSVDEAVGDNPFNCPVGYVTQILATAELPLNAEILMCGPPIMMDKSIEIIKTKGFTDKQIWVSLERHMKCCTGKCGHCMVNDKYVCMDGPVFRYDEVKDIDE